MAIGRRPVGDSDPESLGITPGSHTGSAIPGLAAAVGAEAVGEPDAAGSASAAGCGARVCGDVCAWERRATAATDPITMMATTGAAYLMGSPTG